MEILSKNRKIILIIMLILSIFCFISSLSLMYMSKGDDGLNNLYNYLEKNCYNYDELINNSEFKQDTTYKIEEISNNGNNKPFCIVKEVNEVKR